MIAWDLLTRQAIHEFHGHTEHVNATACSPLDFTIASGATGKSDTSALVWDLKKVLLSGSAGDNISFDRIWSGMGASSIDASISSTMELVRQHSKMIPQLLERIRADVAPSASGDVDQLIQLLDDPKFAVREEATEKLMMIRGKAEAELRRILSQTISAEVRYRITTVLKSNFQRPNINFTDRRRWHRIVFALELINTPQAMAILQRIADGYPNIDVSQDAASAIERNQLRASY